MNIIISDRLAAILPKREEIKINGIVYQVKSWWHTLDIDERNNRTIDVETSELNYFCYNKNNKITCWRISKGEQPVNDSGQWKKEGREKIKPGKFLLLFESIFTVNEIGCNNTEDQELKKKVIQRLCELFTEKVKGCNEELKFEISSNIQEIYDSETAESAGYLNDSCMRVESNYGCREFSGFYNHIPDLKIIYKKVNGLLVFRALYWQNVETDKGEIISFIDRCYGTEQINQQVKEYCEVNNIGFRPFNDNRIILNGESVYVKKQITDSAICYLQDNGSPYVDTLRKLTGDYLSNYLREDYELTDCDGNAVRDRNICDNCGCGVDENNLYHDDNGNILCEQCFYDNYYYCLNCGEVVSNDDAISMDGEVYCDRCADRLNIHCCEKCGEYHKDCYYVDGEGWYCEDCFSDNFFYCEQCETDKRNNENNYVNVDGQEINICDDCLNELNHCEHCDNYFTSELTEVDGEYYCPDCLAELKESEESEVLTEVNN